LPDASEFTHWFDQVKAPPSTPDPSPLGEQIRTELLASDERTARLARVAAIRQAILDDLARYVHGPPPPEGAADPPRLVAGTDLVSARKTYFPGFLFPPVLS